MATMRSVGSSLGLAIVLSAFAALPSPDSPGQPGILVAVSLEDHPSDTQSEADEADDERSATTDWQAAISDYTTALEESAIAAGNFAGASFDNDARSFTVFGTGKAPDKVAKLIEEAPPTVKVRWESVPYTEAELDATSQELLRNERRIHGIGLASDFTGLVATADAADIADIADSARGQEAQDAGVEFVAGEAGSSLQRGAGSGPFRGGSRIQMWTGGAAIANCSTGFRAYRGDDGVMLSAAHCTSLNPTSLALPVSGVYLARLFADQTPVGTFRQFAMVHDTQLINGQGYHLSVWVGPANNSTTEPLSTTASGYLSLNERACLSGGYSGTQCGTVTNTNYDYHVESIDRTDYWEAYDGAAITSDDSIAIAGQGDSGGTGYQFSGGDRRPAGIISYGIGLATCPSFDNGRRCYQTGVIQTWRKFRHDFTPTLTLTR